MKKVFFVLTIAFYCLTAPAQEKMTYEQARLICAQEMAAFTKAVSGAWQTGISYEEFQFALCGKSQPSTEGGNQLKAAYHFLTQGVSNDFIIKNYQGKEIAASLTYLSHAHKKGIESDGAELFGGKTGTANSSFAKNENGGCKWYQFWCLMQSFASWLLMNWPGASQIATALGGPVLAD